MRVEVVLGRELAVALFAGRLVEVVDLAPNGLQTIRSVDMRNPLGILDEFLARDAPLPMLFELLLPRILGDASVVHAGDMLLNSGFEDDRGGRSRLGSRRRGWNADRDMHGRFLHRLRG